MKKIYLTTLLMIIALGVNAQSNLKQGLNRDFGHNKISTPLNRKAENMDMNNVMPQTSLLKSTTANPAVSCNEQDSLSLVALYNSTNGDNWSYKTGWLTDSVYKWDGITIDSDGEVTEIKLEHNNLTGVIPAEIGDLQHLTFIDLAHNQLSSVPLEIGNLENLQWLWLSSNKISSIPSEIGNLNNLTWLYLSDNQLSTVPAETGNLNNLEFLGLSFNQLDSIPAEIGNLSNLTGLYLEDNNLDTLPDLSTLTSLNKCYVENNKLDFGDLENANISCSTFVYSPQETIEIYKTESSGQITFSVNINGTNNQYQWYNLDEEMDGEIKNSITVNKDGTYNCEINNPNYPDLTLISEKEIVGNGGLTLGITNEEFDALYKFYEATHNSGNWTNETNWMSSNDVSTWFGVTVEGYHVTKLSLFSNNIIGTLPSEIGNLTHLKYLNLFNNKLYGHIPTEIGSLTELKRLFLSLNQLDGEIPHEIGNLTQLDTLSFSRNYLNGSIPKEIGNLINLHGLFLYQNSLTGDIPSEIGNLTNLRTLYLYYNKLTGNIPNEIGNLLNLQTLKLHGNQLTGSIPLEIGNLTNLTELWLSNNQFSGSIPPEIGNLTNLNILLLQDNLLVGNIPPEIGNITNLEYLELYTNKLTGNLPAELGNLSNLIDIDVSENQLTGSIPSEINNLTNLTGLWLSSNEFNELPDLSNLTNLTSGCYLDNNKFDFGDLETAGISCSTFKYSPQAKIGTEKHFNPNTGDNITLTITTPGSGNTYQWYKDSVEITGATSDSYNIANYDAVNDKGVYTCNVSNPAFPNLILESENYFVGEIVTGIINSDNSEINIYPNPVNNIVNIVTDRMSGDLTIKIYNVTGEQVFFKNMKLIPNNQKLTFNLTGLKRGNYFIQISNGKQMFTKKLIKK